MRYLIYILCGAALFAGCSKDLSVDSPTLSIDLSNARSSLGDTLVFKLGDTCKFNFQNYADNIIFYSGQPGFSRQFNNRTAASGTPTLSFSSTLQYGTQSNTLKILATRSLLKPDSASIVHADWTDITDRFVLATSATLVPSGAASLADLVSSGNDSLTIAFKYNGTGGSTQRTWTITNFLVRNVLPDRSYTLGSMADQAYWRIFKIGTSPSNWTATSSQLQVAGGPPANAGNESWIVSKPMFVGRVAPDVPAKVIKTISSAEVFSFNFQYSEAGVYKAAFVVSNTSIDESIENVKEFVIKVIP